MSARRWSTALLLAVALTAPVAMAKNGAFKSSPHGSADKGVMRNQKAARGSCSQCHNGHASHKQSSGRAELGLFAPNDNNLCFECHALPSEDGVYPGSGPWLQSTHATSSQVYGGGDPRRNAEANRCVNCHDPHGVRDDGGVIPAMLASREPALCLNCHDGSRGSDIRSETFKASVHGRNARGRHDPHEGDIRGNPNGYNPAERHVTCSDCHDVHRATRDRVRPEAPEASARLLGVSRVQVINGGSGSAPSFTFIAAGDPEPAKEYEICFKCHSSYSRQPQQQPNLALLTNPENPSFHPIQARGKNRGIRVEAFAGERDAESQVTCSDCHSSDDDRLRGPHGSRFEYLLKKEAITSPGRRQMQKDNLCFDCHAFDVYADPASAATTLAASRFNAPATSGHAFHVGLQQVPCYSCHETHGSTRYPALIATGKGRELFSYSQTPMGGTCTSSCHGPSTYTVTYGR